MRRRRQGDGCLQPGSKPSPKLDRAGTPTVAFQPPEPRETRFCGAQASLSDELCKSSSNTGRRCPLRRCEPGRTRACAWRRPRLTRQLPPERHKSEAATHGEHLLYTDLLRPRDPHFWPVGWSLRVIFLKPGPQPRQPVNPYASQGRSVLVD